jgi:hypothetical protein
MKKPPEMKTDFVNWPIYQDGPEHIFDAKISTTEVTYSVFKELGVMKAREPTKRP